MLILLRILFGALFILSVKKAWADAQAAGMSATDLTHAWDTAVSVVLALVNAALWAPYLGEKVAGPLMGTYTQGTVQEQKHRILDLIKFAQKRGWRGLTRWLCFLEGVMKPDLPAAFVIGMRQSRPGSWLEKVFAREVYRFDNAQHCLEAAKILDGHGIKPPPHRNHEVNILLLSQHNAERPERETLPLPEAPPADYLRRDPRIQLFDGAEAAPVEMGRGREVRATKAEDRSVVETGASPADATEAGPSGWAVARQRVWAFLKGE